MGAKHVKANRQCPDHPLTPLHPHPLPTAHTSSTITTGPINTHYHLDAMLDGRVCYKERKAAADKGVVVMHFTVLRGISYGCLLHGLMTAR